MKAGDKVRFIDGMYAGRVATIETMRYNPNMAVYGRGEEIIVRLGDHRILAYKEDLRLV